MKLDPTVLRTMNGQDFRVLEAIEKGMKQHSLVPVPLITSLASLRHGGTNKILSSLLRDKLLSHDKSCGYDGYRITNAGYDILALHNLKSRGFVAAIGDRIGTGKESDIYVAVHPNGQQVVLKFHRLGRTSFRNVKKKRDYFVYHNKGRGASASSTGQANSWLFLSRMSALKEYAFMKALHQVNYPTPTPLAHNRHIVVMSVVRGVPLYQVVSSKLSPEQAESIFTQASDLALQLAKHGLVHCDLNEFNLMVDMSGIQNRALDNEHDPYVRHSGMTVAAESTPGMLSAHGPWERQSQNPDLLLHVNQNHCNHNDVDNGSVDEPLPEPLEYLDNGQPKPTVTLIDFPQMVSTQHPNAKELYERDMTCLYKFFTQKLSCQIPDDHELLLKWEQVQTILKQEQFNNNNVDSVQDDNDNDGDGTVKSVCLASKAQLRLDHELKASGYSQEDTNRDLELYYFETNGIVSSTVQEEEDDDENDNGGNIESPSEIDQKSLGSLSDHEQDDDNNLDNNDDAISMSSKLSQFTANTMTREQMQQHARNRVKQQMEVMKKKSKQRGAFRKHNNNKTFVKGKRVYTDSGM